MVTEARQRTFLLLRTFITRQKKHLLQGYKSYIIPLVDYCSVVWSPKTLGDIKLVESVERGFTKKIPGLKYMSYSDRLKFLGLTTLELRHLRTDLMFCYKLLSGLTSGS